jgi:hypothetical protein
VLPRVREDEGGHLAREVDLGVLKTHVHARPNYKRVSGDRLLELFELLIYKSLTAPFPNWGKRFFFSSFKIDLPPFRSFPDLLVVKVPAEDWLRLRVHYSLEKNLCSLLHRVSLYLGYKLGGARWLGSQLQRPLVGLGLVGKVVASVVRGVHLLVDVIVPHGLVVIHLGGGSVLLQEDDKH